MVSWSGAAGGEAATGRRDSSGRHERRGEHPGRTGTRVGEEQSVRGEHSGHAERVRVWSRGGRALCGSGRDDGRRGARGARGGRVGHGGTEPARGRARQSRKKKGERRRREKKKGRKRKRGKEKKEGEREKEREKRRSRRRDSRWRPRPDEHVRRSVTRSALRGTRKERDVNLYRCRDGGSPGIVSRNQDLGRRDLGRF